MQVLKVQAMCRAGSVRNSFANNSLHQPHRPAPGVRQIRPASHAVPPPAHSANPSAVSRSRSRLRAAVRTCEIRDSVTWSTSAICRSVSSSK